jgi:WD40 repeat protein/Flp pilus assembly protein TadD
MGATVAAWTFRAQRDHIRQAETRGRERLFEALLERARAGRFSRRMGQRFKSLEALSQAADIGRELKLPLGRFEPLRDEAIACLALPDLKQTGRVIHRPPGVFLVAFDAAMTRYALRFLDEVQVRRVADDREIARFPARGFQGIYVLSFSPDGRYLATKHHPGYALTVWDVDQRAVVVDEPGPVSERAAGFSPDSRRIALAREGGEILVYDLATGQPIPLSNVPAARDLAFRPDGGQIAVISSRLNKSSCQILDSRSGQLVRSIPLKGIGEVSVAWSPDGATLAIPCEDLRIYQWDAATGARKATLEGHISKGLLAAFHPSGTLLASNGWEGRLWLWNPVFGRPWLNLANEAWPQFTQFSSDGRIVASLGDKLTTYQVDPALEYRTFARVSAQLNEFGRPSLHPDGRILAAGTSQGVVLWDLALGRELAFLPIENAWHLMFEPSGDLLTSGTLGVWRWPIRLDSGRLDVRVGPPRQLPLPDGAGGIAEDETGQVIAKANFGEAHVLTPSRAFLVGPHDDCRSVTISPDGQWLATGSHSSHGAQVWSMRDASSVAHLTVEGMCRVLFSPDGKRLMTMNPPCRLWNVGTWSEALRIGGTGLCFSPDARLLAVQDANRSIRLADPATGRTLARLEGPELCDVWGATFSRDGSRLVVSTNDGPAVHVWDLRTIRRRLAEMGLDWDAPPFAPPEDSTVDSKHPPAVNVHVDFGPLKRYRDVYWSHLEQHTIPAEELVTDCTYRLRALPGDPDLLHQRGHALLTLNRSEEALADFSAASAKRPRDMHLWAYRGVCHLALEQYEPALDHLEQALQTDPESVLAIADLGKLLNVRAWELVSGARSQSDSLLAARLAQISVALSPGQQTTLNTLGVAQYRASRFAEAIGTLEKSLVAGQGEFDGFDLFFLAMAHHRLGHPNQARACFERAIIWQNTHKIMPERQLREAAAFRAEAESVLGGPGGEPPVDVAPSPR